MIRKIVVAITTTCLLALAAEKDLPVATSESNDVAEEMTEPMTHPVGPEIADNEGEDKQVEIIHAERPAHNWTVGGREGDMPLLIQEAEAGIISTLTSHFFRDYNERLMKSFTESMKGMEAQKYCSANAIGELFTTHLCIGQQTIANYNVRETSSRLWLDPEAN